VKQYQLRDAVDAAIRPLRAIAIARSFSGQPPVHAEVIA